MLWNHKQELKSDCATVNPATVSPPKVAHIGIIAARVRRYLPAVPNFKNCCFDQSTNKISRITLKVAYSCARSHGETLYTATQRLISQAVQAHRTVELLSGQIRQLSSDWSHHSSRCASIQQLNSREE